MRREDGDTDTPVTGSRIRNQDTHVCIPTHARAAAAEPLTVGKFSDSKMVEYEI